MSFQHDRNALLTWREKPTLREKRGLKRCLWGTVLENGAFFWQKQCPKRYHFTDDQTVPQGHHFGATYFFECSLLSTRKPLDRRWYRPRLSHRTNSPRMTLLHSTQKESILCYLTCTSTQKKWSLQIESWYWAPQRLISGLLPSEYRYSTNLKVYPYFWSSA